MNATAYRDMIHLSRPISRHPKMSVKNRAKLFTPFSALRGFDIEILTKEQDRLLVSRVTLDADHPRYESRAEKGHRSGGVSLFQRPGRKSHAGNRDLSHGG